MCERLAAGRGERSSCQDWRSPSSINKAQGNMVLGMYNMLYLTSVINAGAKKDTGNWSIDGDGAEGHYHKDTSYCTMCAWI